MPSSSASANFNPTSLSAVKGFGVESLFQAHNPTAFSVVSGTGKIGGALISPTLENSFFGNRSLEIDDDFLDRRRSKMRYKNKKLNIAFGGKLINRKNFSLDVGISMKRNPAIKKINPGVGLSARFWIFNIGAYIYQDDVKIDLDQYINPYLSTPYSTIYGSSTYQEKFTVKTFSVGTKIKFLSLDAGIIRTKYNFYPIESKVQIYSSGIQLKKTLLNLAYRREETPNMEVEGENLYFRTKKNDMYYGMQYSINKNIYLGVGYNTFLLDEYSATLTIFI
jgi:hypothetical protein